MIGEAEFNKRFDEYLVKERGMSQSEIDERDLEVRERFLRRDLGMLVNQAREKLGLTQQQLTALSGVPQSEISRIEKGRANPTYLTLCRLAKALEMPLPLSQGLVAND